MKFLGLISTVLPLALARPEDRHFPNASSFFQGHDLSSLLMVERDGYIFKDTAKNNETRSAEAILGDGGMNSVRLRQWVNPADGNHSLEYNLELAKRFNGQGYKILLDLFLSDSWADPAHQDAPAGWPTELEPLKKTVRGYVKDTLVAYHNAKINIDILALGNEIRYGILWPVGRANVDIPDAKERIENFGPFVTLWKAARAGVNDAIATGVRKPEIMLHIDNGWDLGIQQRFLEAFTANKVSSCAWDIYGVSFYSFFGGSSATFANLRTSLNWIAENYRKPVQVVETAFPAVCDGKFNPIPVNSEPEIPYSVDGQARWISDLVGVVKSVSLGLGRGVWYWEGAWLNHQGLGTGCNDVILFETDFYHRPNPVGYSRKSVNFPK